VDDLHRPSFPGPAAAINDGNARFRAAGAGRLDLRPGSKAYRLGVGQYRISQLAERVDVPATTLRYYEAQGLLPARRTANGYRTYDDGDVERVRFITTAKALGLPLTRIRDLVDARQDGPCRDVRDRLLPLVAEQLAGVDRRVAELREFRAHLVAARAELDALPARDTPCDPACSSPGAQPRSTAPVACSLDAGDHARRVQRWRDALAGATPQRSPDGAVRIRLDADRLPALAELVAAEARCCPFLTFTLTVTADGLQLAADAPDEARPVLDELVGSPAC
jgi:MerR family transcriptional regulator, copper efflux regulator